MKLQQQMKNVLSKFIVFAIILAVGYSVKKEIERQHPEFEKDTPVWMWRF